MGNSKEGTVWHVPGGKLWSALTKLFNSLSEHGGEIVLRIDDNAAYRDQVARLLIRSLSDTSVIPTIPAEYTALETKLGMTNIIDFYNAPPETFEIPPHA